jgi:4a-hydroxytetrahydrobiopterin dehydratase
MTNLAQFQCIPCRGGEPTLSDEEIARLKPEAPDWNVVESGEVLHLERAFKFKNFVQALEFTNRVAELAEEQGHHPALLTEWGKVTVTWWTHKIKGLHRNDFIMAAKTDKLYQKPT